MARRGVGEIMEQSYRHESQRANAVLSNLPPGAKLHELCLPRSVRKPTITERSEAVARVAAAKLCQRQRRRIVDVWAEDGEHWDWGLYRLWFVVTVPDGKAN